MPVPIQRRALHVSTDYYARLEQGRHPHVSETVLEAVVGALRLDDLERGYLFELARPKTPGPDRHRPARVPRVRPAVHRMLDVLDDVSPALVINHRSDVLAGNHLAHALITDFDTLPYRERNLARFVLLHPAARDLYRDWDKVAETFVASLRLAAGRHHDDPQLNELVGELSIKVPQFHTWWASHRVDQCAHGTQRLRHPVVGELTLSYETLALPADPDLMHGTPHTTGDQSCSAHRRQSQNYRVGRVHRGSLPVRPSARSKGGAWVSCGTSSARRPRPRMRGASRV
ncbi:helix-turn-helix domain-containing protein [Streptomyces sp. RLB3-6]|nr:helix-turn-helix domain-containing protein [Streptomyces sp. RLB3-6]